MKDEKTLKITDRRTFNKTGAVKDKEALTKEQEQENSKDQNSKEQSKKKVPEKVSKTNSRQKESPKLNNKEFKPIEINFATFVSSLHTSALIHLGLISNPINNEVRVDPELAKQNIDILEMLQAKTKGNLSTEEENLLSNALYELRMTYVEISKKQN